MLNLAFTFCFTFFIWSYFSQYMSSTTKRKKNYSVDQLFLTSHFVSKELSFHSSQHWSILHENWWKSTAFDRSINVSDCFCLLWSNENFSFQKLATHTS